MKYIKDYVDLNQKRVLLRLDLNVPLKNGIITDQTRIDKILPVINFLIKKKSKIIIISHIGRPEGKINKNLSLKPICENLEKKINKKVTLIKKNVFELKKNDLFNDTMEQIIFLENIRFYEEEEKNDIDFSKHLSELGDLFVNDAFSCSHRVHASVCKITEFLPSFAGLQLETEINALKKEKPDSIPLPDKKVEKLDKIEEKKQNPVIEDIKVKQVSEFEKDELFDPNSIAALIDKSKEDIAETNKKNNRITQSEDKSMNLSNLTLSEEDALKAQIFSCWSIPLGLPYNENLLVRIKLKLKPDGSVIKSEILDHARMNKPGQSSYKVLAESALRAIRLCQPLRVPATGYERWKDLQLNFDAREMLEG